MSNSAATEKECPTCGDVGLVITRLYLPGCPEVFECKACGTMVPVESWPTTAGRPESTERDEIAELFGAICSAKTEKIVRTDRVTIEYRRAGFNNGVHVTAEIVLQTPSGELIGGVRSYDWSRPDRLAAGAATSDLRAALMVVAQELGVGVTVREAIANAMAAAKGEQRS